MIAIIDYGMGNIRSVQNALDYLKIEHIVTNKPEEVLKADKLILPGVGSFSEAMKNLNELGLTYAIKKVVLDEKKPILGICLGMQLLAETGDEDGPSKGLGFIEGNVSLFPAEKLNIRIPHMGFNIVKEKKKSILFEDVSEADFYFVHSFRLVCENKEDVLATVDYGEEFACAVEKNNIYGTQFHPEKSQSNGLKMLRSWCSNA